MKTLSSLLIAAFFIVSACSAQTQDKFSIYTSLGYGFGIGGRLIDSSVSYNGLTLLESTDLHQNYGKGMKVEIGALFGIMHNVDLQTGFVYSWGIPYIEETDQMIFGTAETNTTLKHKHSQFGIKVLVLPNFEVFKLFDAYAGVGIGVFFNFSSAEVSRTGGYEALITDSNKPSPAFLGCFGLDFPLNDILHFFVETGFEAMSSTMKETRITESDFTTSDYDEKTIEYKEDSVGLSAPPKTPGSNINVRLGLRLNIL